MGLGSAALFFIGCIAVVIAYGLWATWNAKKEHNARQEEDPLSKTAHVAALEQQISEVLQDARSSDVDEAVAALSTERASGKGWDTAIRTALPKLANFQLLQLKNSIAALVRSGKSERESIEIALRSFLRPPA